MYVALFPCNECAKLIIQSGVKDVIYLSDKYHDDEIMVASRRLFDLAGVCALLMEEGGCGIRPMHGYLHTCGHASAIVVLVLTWMDVESRPNPIRCATGSTCPRRRSSPSTSTKHDSQAWCATGAGTR